MKQNQQQEVRIVEKKDYVEPKLEKSQTLKDIAEGTPQVTTGVKPD